MKEAAIYQKLREWVYKTYGQIDTQRKTGLTKIFKLSTLALYGEAGWPDMMICVKAPERKGYVFYIELKSATGVCTELQLQRHAELRAMGFEVFVVNSVTAGREIVTRQVDFALGRKPKKIAFFGVNR